MKLSHAWLRSVCLPMFCIALLGLVSLAEAESRRADQRAFLETRQLEISEPDGLDAAPRLPGDFPLFPEVIAARELPEDAAADPTRNRRILVHMSPALGRAAPQRANVKALVRNVGGFVKYEYDVVLPNVMALRDLSDADVERIRRMPGVVQIEEDEYHPNLVRLDEATPLVRGLQSQLTAAGLPYDGTGIRVCVADTGIKQNHIMYADRIDFSAGWDFHNNDSDPEDDNGHGTHVAGIAVGRTGLNVDFGCDGPEPFEGVASGATLIGVKILNASGGGFSSNIIAGINHCADQSPTGGRADVINLSIGTGNFAGLCTHSWAVAANNAVANGVVVVAASGNEARTNSMGSPACGVNVIAVGATYKDDYPNCENGTSTFNWGVCTDVSPSQDQVVCFSNKSDFLDVTAPGSVIWSASIAASGNGIVAQSGTSMASPMVAGLAALILDANPSLTPAEVRQIIRDGAIDLGPAGFDRAYGHGRIDVINSLNLAAPGGCTMHAECDDGIFCNGAEQCVAGVCQPGTPPNCDDGVACTVNSCNESLGACEAIPNDSLCDDGLFCNGAEWCHATLGCQAGTPPNCNDGVACTVDSCNETLGACQNVPNDALCDDGLFCNGAEWCHATLGCQAGTPPNCNDGVACTVDSCNEALGACENIPNDSLCDDGLFCNGAEWCHETMGCQAGSDPCPGQICNEASGSCQSGGCVTNADCDDGLFCTGEQVCDAGTCVPAPGGGVANGTFDGGTSWTNNTPVGGTITYPGNLRVVGPNSNSQGFAWAVQSGISVSGGIIEFDLLSYSSSDTGAWDYPVFFLNGQFRGLNSNGSLGAVTSGGTGGSGTINNSNQVSSPIHFVVNINALAGHSGPHTIGFGVASADGAFGAGTAVFDNVLPPQTAGGDPCPGQLCDEVAQACVDCLVDADCDDGVFCNGQETCQGGTCVAAQIGGVANGTFDGGASWTNNTPVGGTITYPGNLRVVGPNSSSQGFAWAAQSGVTVSGGIIEFDLLSYSSSDTGAWDYPVFFLNGQFRGLNSNGTLGAVTSGNTSGSGTINNNNQVSSPIHFVVNINALAGHSGPHTIGFGVASADGRFGAGTAVFDNVVPPLGDGDPCPGQTCDEQMQTCVP